VPTIPELTGYLRIEERELEAAGWAESARSASITPERRRPAEAGLRSSATSYLAY